MNILSKYVYKKYLLNIKPEAQKVLTSDSYKKYASISSQDEWDSFIYYMAMGEAIRNLHIYLIDKKENTFLEYFLEQHYDSTVDDKHTPAQYIINENKALNAICYNAEILYELNLFEQTLNKKELTYILKEVLQISNHEIANILN